MTTASVLAPCKTCDLKVCSGPEDCPYVIKEEIPFPSIKPAVHNQKYALKIPNDISPILKKNAIAFPQDGKISIFWDKKIKKVSIVILDNTKKKDNRQTVFHVSGNENLKKRTLHFRGNVLIKIQS
ncbi:MAG TPA: hypothetical protein PKI16_01410 [Candidatus Dojkabacteria bacterium]|nr:hypothetical protein [Candidatus Dojkabacteria bacterium]